LLVISELGMSELPNLTDDSEQRNNNSAKLQNFFELAIFF